MYANLFCPAADPCDLLRLLHGPYRTACRLVMILLSQQGLSAAQIAGLLGYDPSTTPGKNRRRTIFGAVDLASGRFLYQVTHKAISVSFTAFCEQLLAAYPAAPLVAVVCDNVIIHHCWRPARRTAHPGCPRVTCRTSGRPPSIYKDICAKATG